MSDPRTRPADPFDLGASPDLPADPFGIEAADSPELSDRVAALLSTLKNGPWLARQVFPPVQWAVPGLIPEGFGLFTGAPKAGKSWCSLAIGLAVASGGLALGSIPVGVPRPVLLLALEDGHRRLQDRCRKLLDGEPFPRLLDFQTNTAPADVVPLVGGWLAQHHGTAPLVILDTLGKVAPPALPGEGAYSRDYRVGSSLKRLTDEHPGACLLVVHHVRKATSDDWMDSTSGTNGLNGAADWTVNLSRDRNKSTGRVRVTGRDVIEGEYAVTIDDGRWTLDGDSLAEAARRAADAEATANLGDRATELFEYIARQDGPVSPSQVVAALDFPDARRYMARMADAGRLVRIGRGAYTCPQTPVPTVPMSQPDDMAMGQRDTWDTPRGPAGGAR